ncbi:MAG TPA: hypothetical protein VHE35_00355 [Kofleriaceae bacterium]|nr:hypothetical protein [Kofleriaceae bacterium]
MTRRRDDRGGALTTAGDLGLGWKTALAVPLRLGDHLRPEVTLGASGATAGERHAGAGLGVGVRR